jgi:heme exporter protein A
MNTPDQTPLLIVTGLTHRFGVVTALSNIDLEIFKGDFISIFGPNGAGKTTLLKLFARLAKPTQGQIEFSSPMNQEGPWHIGYVSHLSLLYEELTGYENLHFYAKLYGLPEPEILAGKQLRKMGLEFARNQLTKSYSSGMKQRLSIARALLHDPALLLLDEPYAGLDQHGSRLLSGLLENLKAEGRTVLLITHNIEQGLALSNRLIVLNRGRIVMLEDCSETVKASFEALYFKLIDKSGIKTRTD